MSRFSRTTALAAGFLAVGIALAGADPRPAPAKDAHGIRPQPGWSHAFALGAAPQSLPPRAPLGTGVHVYPSPPWVGPGLRSYSQAMPSQPGTKATPRPPVLVVVPHASVTILRLPPDPDECLDTSRTTLRILRFHSK